MVEVASVQVQVLELRPPSDPCRGDQSRHRQKLAAAAIGVVVLIVCTPRWVHRRSQGDQCRRPRLVVQATVALLM